MRAPLRSIRQISLSADFFLLYYHFTETAREFQPLFTHSAEKKKRAPPYSERYTLSVYFFLWQRLRWLRNRQWTRILVVRSGTGAKRTRSSRLRIVRSS